MGVLKPMPTPEVLGRNGTYVAFRKLHTKVAAYRRYLRARAATPDEENLLGAKMVGRWQSGAPLALARNATSPGSVPISVATTTSASPMTLVALSARWGPTPGAPTHAMPWTMTAAWTSGCTA